MIVSFSHKRGRLKPEVIQFHNHSYSWLALFKGFLRMSPLWMLATFYLLDFSIIRSILQPILERNSRALNHIAFLIGGYPRRRDASGPILNQSIRSFSFKAVELHSVSFADEKKDSFSTFHMLESLIKL